jgi:hypothetical protein
MGQTTIAIEAPSWTSASEGKVFGCHSARPLIRERAFEDRKHDKHESNRATSFGPEVFREKVGRIDIAGLLKEMCVRPPEPLPGHLLGTRCVAGPRGVNYARRSFKNK